MSRRALEKSVRMFRTMCEETIRRGGSTPLGAQGVQALTMLEDVLAGKRRFDGSLLKPLAAFAHLLSSGQLPPGFARCNLGDALLAVGEVSAHEPPTWPFDPGLAPATAARLGFDAVIAGIDRLELENRTGWSEHGAASTKFILAAVELAPGRNRVIVAGGARAYDVPLAPLAEMFEQVVVTDVCLEAAEENVRQRVGDKRRARVKVDRFDLTGSYNQFVATVDAVLAAARDVASAERALVDRITAYDAPSGAARLSGETGEADLAISSMVLSQLGVAYKAYVERCFGERGWDRARVKRSPLEPALSTLGALVEQHHIAALLDGARLAVLTSDVSAQSMVRRPDGSLEPHGQTEEQLSVEALVDRIPGRTEIIADTSWEWPRVEPEPGRAGMTMRVDAIAMRRRAT
jgi:hypothetical protein